MITNELDKLAFKCEPSYSINRLKPQLPVIIPTRESRKKPMEEPIIKLPVKLKLLTREAILKYLWQCKRSRAKKAGRNFILSLEEHSLLVTRNCSYCGIAPYHEFPSRIRLADGCEPILINQIDRKNNNWGYTPANSVSCCEICNRAKRAMKYSEWLAYLTRIGKFWG